MSNPLNLSSNSLNLSSFEINVEEQSPREQESPVKTQQKVDQESTVKNVATKVMGESVDPETKLTTHQFTSGSNTPVRKKTEALGTQHLKNMNQPEFRDALISKLEKLQVEGGEEQTNKEAKVDGGLNFFSGFSGTPESEVDNPKTDFKDDSEDLTPIPTPRNEGTETPNPVKEKVPSPLKDSVNSPEVEAELTQNPVQQEQVEGNPTEQTQQPVTTPETPVTYTLDQFKGNNHSFKIDTPPQKLLEEAVKLGKGKDGFANAKVKIKLSLDQQLRNETTGTAPDFKVEPYTNPHSGKTCYKVMVKYTIELTIPGTNPGDDPKTETLTLEREFFTNIGNKKEALAAVYNVAKSVKQLAVAPDDYPNKAKALKCTQFEVSFNRDPRTNAILGIKSVMADGVNITERKSDKKVYKKEIDEEGRVKLQRGKGKGVNYAEGETKTAKLLKANFSSDTSLLDQLGEKSVDLFGHVVGLKADADKLMEKFDAVKSDFIQHDIINWMKSKNDKSFDQIAAALKAGADPSTIEGLPQNIQKYIVARRELDAFEEKEKVSKDLEEAIKMKGELEAIATHFSQLEKGTVPPELTQSQKNLLKEIEKRDELKKEDGSSIPIDAAAVKMFLAEVDYKENRLKKRLPELRSVDGPKVKKDFEEAQTAVFNDHKAMLGQLSRLQEIHQEVVQIKDELTKLKEELEKATDIQVYERDEKLSVVNFQLKEVNKVLKTGKGHEKISGVQKMQSRFAALVGKFEAPSVVEARPVQQNEETTNEISEVTVTLVPESGE